MASIFQISEEGVSSTQQPVQHSDERYENSTESKEEAKCRLDLASLHVQMERTRKAYDKLKDVMIRAYETLETKCNQLKVNEERFEEISCKISTINFDESIKLNIGGNMFQTSIETLTRKSESVIAGMFSSKFNLKRGDDGCYFIDRDGTHFRHILNYLRTGKIPSSSVLNANSEEILDEAEYYGLAGLVNAIKNKMNGSDENEGGDVGVTEEGDEKLQQSIVEIAGKELCAAEVGLNSYLSLLDASMKFLEEATDHHNKITKKLDHVHFSETVKIDVGGRVFKTTLKALKRESDSLLASMFSERFALKKEDDGCFFIDRDGTYFHHILNYLRVGTISDKDLEDCASMIYKEAEFYKLPALKELVDKWKTVKIIVGGMEFVATREMLVKYPDSLFGRMLSGRTDAFEKRDDGSFYIDRDSSCFQHILDYLDVGTISYKVLEVEYSQIKQEAEFYMLEGLQEQILSYNIVKINVGGMHFTTTRDTLKKRNSGIFGRILSHDAGTDIYKLADGSFFIDHDGKYFGDILYYLQHGRYRSVSHSYHHDSEWITEFHRELEFYTGSGF